MSSDRLIDEAERVTAMLAGKVVRTVWRHREGELGIEFEDGTRLFAEVTHGSQIELSITGGPEPVDGG